ncbi:IDEAL domain-containing protein [Priestia megaterium]
MLETNINTALDQRDEIAFMSYQHSTNPCFKHLLNILRT